jgi:two-component system cell cycle sensor histidine kinase PleC
VVAKLHSPGNCVAVWTTVLSTGPKRESQANFDLDRVRLRFKDPEVEKNFSAWSFASSIWFTRLYLLGAVILYATFGLLDTLVSGPMLGTLWLIRYGVVLPGVVFILAFTFHPSFERYMQFSLLATGWLCGIGVIAMAAVLPVPDASRYYAGLIMVVIYSGGLIGLRFYYGLASTLVIVLGYQIVAIAINPIPEVDFISNNFFLLMSAGVGISSTYVLDVQARRQYVAQRIIEAKNAATGVLLDRAEAANRAKSEFLTNMSHELRTPLNAIIGFSEIIRQEHLGPVGSPKYMEYATDIHDSGRHLLTIINDILDLARAEAGKLVIREEVFDFDVMVRMVFEQMEPAAAEEELAFTMRNAGSPIYVQGDERLLRQVVLNLVSNAIKFTPAGGQISVSLRTGQDIGVEFSVTDTGVGIPAEDVERILRPFEQVERALTRSHGGAGLGLSYAVKIIELHGGGLSLESQRGVGTTARFNLPPMRISAHTEDDSGVYGLGIA